MKKLKITFLGAGSGFVLTVAKELPKDPIFDGCELALADPQPDRLAAAEKTVAAEFEKQGKTGCYTVTSHTDNNSALDGADYVISACEPNRYANWYRDLAIAEEYGCYQIKGENGGPGGIIHGLRNMIMFSGIAEKMERCCPDAKLLNFANPMSFICTYLHKYTKIRTYGFCHQVHGSFGVVAEMLGMPPGELEVITAGVNHMNWLFDIRHRGTGKSCMEEFISKMRTSKYWHDYQKIMSNQMFSREVYETFRMYPVGYDEHIIEYMPFFWNKEEWDQYGFEAMTGKYKDLAEKKQHILEMQQNWGDEIEFPADPNDPYYAENPCRAIVALEKNIPTYFDAINIPNNGAVDNLPADVILDVPGIAIGGEIRSIHVGAMPPGPQEICRRQVAQHEMLAQACYERDDKLVEQVMCLAPYVTSLTQARNIWQAYKKEYKDYLPGF